MDVFKIKLRVMVILLYALLLASAQQSVAQGLIQQTKQWSNFNLQGSLFDASPWMYVFEIQSRSIINPDKLEEVHVRGGAGWQGTKTIGLWTGFQWNSHHQVSGASHSNRAWQQLIWRALDKDYMTLTTQSRLEERSQSDQLQWNIRFRQQMAVELSTPLSSKWRPFIWDELFFNITRPAWVSNVTVEQNRAFTGVKFIASPSCFFAAGYLNQYLFRETSNQMNNIFYLGIFITT